MSREKTEKAIRVVAISAGRNIPSRRFRIQALVPYLKMYGVQLDEICPRVSSYPPRNRLYRPLWFAAAVAERLSYLWRTKGYDAVILQRELISTLATIEHLLPLPRIFDIDDAIYLRRNGVAARRISSQSSLVVCGNTCLAEKFSEWNKNVAVIPTGVDVDRLCPISHESQDDDLKIGWIGTSGNFRYLEKITPALTEVMRVKNRVTLQIISDTYPQFLSHFGDRLDFRKWEPGIENELLPTLSIGVMPLDDDEWSRGKCAFKMLQYMSAGVPVVVSPVGMNAELLGAGDVGIGAVSNKEWSDSLIFLLENRRQRLRMGRNGRHLAVSKYGLSSVALLWRLQLDRII